MGLTPQAALSGRSMRRLSLTAKARIVSALSNGGKATVRVDIPRLSAEQREIMSGNQWDQIARGRWSGQGPLRGDRLPSASLERPTM
jgi:hypothetical protein